MTIERSFYAAQMRRLTRRMTVLAGVILAGILAASPLSASDRWLTNYEQAMSVAQQTGRPVLKME